ncbi:hypothetical protein CKAH01_09813 [Colletotrichum kahawae]|uniref:Uncharacterized protein n=1 Tax=Colletotrichum kahawae TaxID=34407 RepID=A0AAE0CY62_COLKA|nr:hypothetical protein CKAH01_09813 [Colletotrichum kahawae]
MTSEMSQLTPQRQSRPGPNCFSKTQQQAARKSFNSSSPTSTPRRVLADSIGRLGTATPAKPKPPPQDKRESDVEAHQ